MQGWRAQNLQVVWFVHGQPAASAADFFTALFGRAPSNSQSGQIPNVPGGFVTSAGGTQGLFTCQIQTQPGRVDCNFSPAVAVPVSPVVSQSGPPLIEDVGDAIASSLDAAKAGAKLNVNAHRLALVGNFSFPADSAANATEKLAERLGVDFIPSDATDVSFTINRRIALTGLKASNAFANRVLQWSIMTFQFVQFNTPPGASIGVPGFGGAFQMSGPSIQQTYATSLMIDVNTTPLVGPTSPWKEDEQITIFEQLSHMMRSLWQQNSPRALQ